MFSEKDFERLWFLYKTEGNNLRRKLNKIAYLLKFHS